MAGPYAGPMGAGHDHGHSHASGRAEDRRRLLLVLAVTGSVVIVEAVGAWVSGSLALLADAGHMLTDAVGILIALSASLIATRPANAKRTFGYHRVEILAAIVNALVLLALCVYLAYAGIRRLIDPVLAPRGLDQQDAGLAVGLEVDPGSQLAVEQEREDVVAVDALGLGDVDLDAVAEAPDALRARSFPDERVEG